MFNILRKYRMKLNPLKYAFGVGSGKCLGFMVSQRGIKANPEKINVLLEMSFPMKPKEVMSLVGRVATLSCFVSQATDCCILFFDVLKGSKKFEWTKKMRARIPGPQRPLRTPVALIKANRMGKVLPIHRYF